jgi:hypothetical protein
MQTIVRNARVRGVGSALTMGASQDLVDACVGWGDLGLLFVSNFRS